VLCVQGLKKTQASKLGRKSLGGSLRKKKFNCGLSFVLPIVHAFACLYCLWSHSATYFSSWLCFVAPHGKTWADFFPFVVCKFVAMGGFTIAQRWSSFLIVCSSCFCFSLLLYYSLWLFSIVLLLLMVSLYYPLWSSSTPPHGHALLLLVVALCYSSLWLDYAPFCG